MKESSVVCTCTCRVELPKDPRRVGGVLYDLTFINVTKQDAQVIQCNITNKHGYNFTNAYINVYSECDSLCIIYLAHHYITETKFYIFFLSFLLLLLLVILLLLLLILLLPFLLFVFFCLLILSRGLSFFSFFFFITVVLFFLLLNPSAFAASPTLRPSTFVTSASYFSYVCFYS